MGKIIGGIVVVIILIVAVAVGLLYFNLDKVIIAAVEEYGSEVTQTDVVLEEVDLDLTSGKGALKGFSVGNPTGFEEPTAVQFGTVSVAVNIGDSNEEIIHIQEIRVAQPAITYEVNKTTNNLDAIQKNVDEFLAKHAGKEDSASTEEDSGEGPKVIIDNIYITDGLVTVKAPIMMDQKVEGRLPDIHLKDIGKDEGGASPGEVTAQIIESISGSALNVIGKLGIGKNLDSLMENAGALADKVGAGKAGEAVKGVTEGASGTVEGAGKSIKKLFND
jgi:uncharacterized protein involved in outer membrane biogenesis